MYILYPFENKKRYYLFDMITYFQRWLHLNVSGTDTIGVPTSCLGTTNRNDEKRPDISEWLLTGDHTDIQHDINRKICIMWSHYSDIKIPCPQRAASCLNLPVWNHYWMSSFTATQTSNETVEQRIISHTCNLEPFNLKLKSKIDV